MNFKKWLLIEHEQNVNLQQAIQIATAHNGPISAKEMRIDTLQNAARLEKSISFDSEFAVANIGRRIQGYDMQRVMQMIGVMFQALNLPAPQDPRQIDKQVVQQHVPKIKEMLPPIIVSVMPDESYDLDDGNHRLGCARVLGLLTMKAFVIRD